MNTTVAELSFELKKYAKRTENNSILGHPKLIKRYIGRLSFISDHISEKKRRKGV